jgi:hypothetical protein
LKKCELKSEGERMNAITTKYICATNFRGGRIKATAGNGQSIIIDYPAEYDSEKAHAQAAIALCKKMDWTHSGKLVSGGTKDGWVFCFEQSEKYPIN